MDLRVVTVVGNSMDLAGLEDGATVPTRPISSANHGDVVVVEMPGGGLVIKRFYQGRPYPGFSGAWLVPESTDPRWQPRPFLRGRVIAVVLGLLPRQRPDLLSAPILMRGSDVPPPPARTRHIEETVYDSVQPLRRFTVAPPAPPLPEDVFCAWGTTRFARRLRAFAEYPEESLVLLQAWHDWNRVWGPRTHPFYLDSASGGLGQGP